MRPQPASSIPGRTDALSTIGPRTLIASAAVTAAGSRSGVGPSGQTTAALFTRSSTGPSSATARASAAWACVVLPTSAGTASAVRPRSWISAATASSWSPLRAIRATLAPASASPSATSRPIPRPAPVTSATRPSSAASITRRMRQVRRECRPPRCGSCSRRAYPRSEQPSPNRRPGRSASAGRWHLRG